MGGSLTSPIVDSRIEERAARGLSNAPVTVQGLLRRAYEGNASPRQAIKAFCLQCTGYDREAVRKCTAPACPLFAYRPFVAGDPGAPEKTREALMLAKKA
jgi:hypothetical protein